MKRFQVTYPVAGSVTIEVDAEDRSDAIDRGMDLAYEAVDRGEFEELDVYSKLVEGNVVYASVWRVDVEELEDAT